MVSTAGWVISVCSSCCSGRCDRRRVVGVDEDVVGERPAEQRRHHPVGLGEGLRDDRLGGRAARSSMFTYCEPWPVKRNADLAARRRGPGRRPARAQRPPDGRLAAPRAPRAPCPPCRRGRRRRRSRWRPGRGRRRSAAAGAAGAGASPRPAASATRAEPVGERGLVGRPDDERSPRSGALAGPGSAAALTAAGAGADAANGLAVRRAGARGRTPRARRGSWCRRSRRR